MSKSYRELAKRNIKQGKTAVPHWVNGKKYSKLVKRYSSK